MNKEILDRMLEENDGKEFYIQYLYGKVAKKWKLYPSGKVVEDVRMRKLDGDVIIEKHEVTPPVTGEENQRQSGLTGPHASTLSRMATSAALIVENDAIYYVSISALIRLPRMRSICGTAFFSPAWRNGRLRI